MEGDWLDLATKTHNDTADLTWLMEALAHARKQERTKLLGYLEAVLDDTVFEMEMAARSVRR